jgi:hypothetical protein
MPQPVCRRLGLWWGSSRPEGLQLSSRTPGNATGRERRTGDRAGTEAKHKSTAVLADSRNAARIEGRNEPWASLPLRIPGEGDRARRS